ncbi:Predicted glycosyl transferase [Desulfonatronum thiosulfatophilum]|uniref:Predicted glycosyl transferase n=1 Tax=Desulfonatronum thiosulfatophilum TaxID=617002 RepID=A0A1G6AK25_9BACT|nr:glycosyltransferase [Desulfonatronum thiosulfatophilum]SDB08768.1 Predicted glycosyl transferase [Desulfonatronum thiosulfatophilum]
MSETTFNILMYSHDTYGLGHIRRTMAIAAALQENGVNVLILTGSPIAGRYSFPTGIDFVRMPGMIKQTNTIYLPHSIRVDPRHAIHIRRSIIEATAKAFDPHIFIVDKVPLGLKGEISSTLEWFKRKRPRSRVILGLRDILDDAQSTRSEWAEKGYNDILDKLYDEIWIYGRQDLYDPIAEYAIPRNIAAKTTFVGYIPRLTPSCLNGSGNGSRPPGRKQQVLVTIGGGGDGYAVLDNWLTMLEKWPNPPFSTQMITGPFLSGERRDQLAERAKRQGVRFAGFCKSLEKKIACSDLVVSMGGYNTVCEILSLNKPSLLIPRNNPRMEQQIRAMVMSQRGLVEYIPWDAMTPELLRQKTEVLLDHPQSYIDAVTAFSMTGLEKMRGRVAEFRGA